MPPPDPSFLDTGVGASPHNSRSHTRDGWGAIANALREADEEHIKQYEGDIDTILVFVGLFSAVMTAFLIASYGSLLQDPTTVQTLLLRQIALQTSSYSSNANFLNSTTLYNPQILPEFQPSANAIRVNILWFASLTLSLVSASICIFVKQWLREYLAGEYTSPRARLRVRDSRRKGAEDWYLFEIAAAVPLILQICLGLFLLGLCFFTAEVHNTVGYTTLPLVAGWAFLVIIFIFFPTFSHSCPYKTPLISQWSSGARKFLAWLLKSVVRDDVKKTSIYERSSAARTNDPGSKITTSDSSDFDVLVNIDSSQRDERLLDDLWDAANQLSDVSYERLVSFVHELIRHRDPSFENSKDSNLQGFYDLRSLSKPTVASILSMISKVLEDYMTRSNPNFDALNSDTADSRWMRGCILILLAGTSTPIPENATHVLSKILSNPSYHIPLFKFLRSRSLGKLEEVFSELFDKLQDAFLLIPEYTRMTGAAVDFFDVYFNDDRSVIYSLEGIRDRHPEIKGGPVRQIGTLEILRFKNCTAAGVRDWKPPAYFLPRIVRYLANSDGTWRHLVVEILKTFLYQAAGVLQVCQLASFMIQVEVSPRGVSTMEEPVLSEVEEKIERRWKNEVVSLLNEALLAFDMINLTYVVRAFGQQLSNDRENYFELDRSRSDPVLFILVDPLQALQALLHVLPKMRAQSNSKSFDPIFCMLIRDLLIEANGVLCFVAKLNIKIHASLAEKCLDIVNELTDFQAPVAGDSEPDRQAFEKWANDFSEKDSLFPDSFIVALQLYLSPERDYTHIHRIRRLGVVAAAQQGEQLHPGEQPHSGEQPYPGEPSSSSGVRVATSSRYRVFSLTLDPDAPEPDAGE